MSAGLPVSGYAGWVEYRDPTGAAYYYNATSDTTSWELPSGNASVA